MSMKKLKFLMNLLQYVMCAGAVWLFNTIREEGLKLIDGNKGVASVVTFMILMFVCYIVWVIARHSNETSEEFISYIMNTTYDKPNKRITYNKSKTGNRSMTFTKSTRSTSKKLQ